jgi:hypothetical protein
VPRPILKWALKLCRSRMRMLCTGVTPRTAPRVRLSRFTIGLYMKLFFAGATHAGQIRVREPNCMTLKRPLILMDIPTTETSTEKRNKVSKYEISLKVRK